jgi:uncharacterized SAM-binding protein YcdF (DUF218 family)
MIHTLTDILTDPFIVMFLLTGTAIAWLWRKPRETSRRHIWVTGCFVVMYIVCMPLSAQLALGTLEWGYPPMAANPETDSPLVILGGYVHPPSRSVPAGVLGTDSLFRCVRGQELYHQADESRLIVVCGGKLDPDDAGPTLAQAMHDTLVRYGVASRDIVMEDRSQNTHENARNVSELLRQRGIERIVLITDATHLRRSEACFQAQGIAVVPLGVNYRTLDYEWSLDSLLPSTYAARDLRAAAHEWLGLAWYGMKGYL